MATPAPFVADGFRSARARAAWVGALGALVLVVPGRSLAAEPHPDARPVIVVGDRDYAPLSYLDAGVPRGFDVDVAEVLARTWGRPVRIELMEWERAQQKVRTGEADVLLGMSVSEERRAEYDF